MLNKDKRSILLSLILGDGCLHRSGPAQRNKMGYISIKHGHKQKAYVEFKANLISTILQREVKVHPAKSQVKALNKTYEQYKLQVGMTRMRSWRKFCYPNNKKSFSKILPFIRHPALALALWIMDDGTGSTSGNKNDPNGRVCGGLTLFLGECYQEDAKFAQDWIHKNFNVIPKLRWQAVKYKGTIRYYPELKFNVQQAIAIYNAIKPVCDLVPSMYYKFRLLEERANRTDLLQPQTLAVIDTASEDIVRLLKSKVKEV